MQLSHFLSISVLALTTTVSASPMPNPRPTSILAAPSKHARDSYFSTTDANGNTYISQSGNVNSGHTYTEVDNGSSINCSGAVNVVGGPCGSGYGAGSPNGVYEDGSDDDGSDDYNPAAGVGAMVSSALAGASASISDAGSSARAAASSAATSARVSPTTSASTQRTTPPAIPSATSSALPQTGAAGQLHIPLGALVGTVGLAALLL